MKKWKLKATEAERFPQFLRGRGLTVTKVRVRDSDGQVYEFAPSAQGEIVCDTECTGACGGNGTECRFCRALGADPRFEVVA